MDVGQSPWFTDVDGLAIFVYQGVIFELPAGRFTVDGLLARQDNARRHHWKTVNVDAVWRAACWRKRHCLPLPKIVLRAFSRWIPSS